MEFTFLLNEIEESVQNLEDYYFSQIDSVARGVKKWNTTNTVLR